MKKFTLGFITGGIICAAVTGFAVEYAVTANPYPVKVNGIETTIQGYNINDETYFKLRDVSAAVGGFEVGFENNAIIVNTPNKPTPEPTAQNTALNPDGTRKYTIDGLPIEYYEGIGYVNTRDIEKKYNVMGVFSSALHDKQGAVILDNVPTDPANPFNVNVDFYETTMYPLLINQTE